MTNVNTCTVLAQVWPFAQPQGLIPRRAKCETFRAKTHLCEQWFWVISTVEKKFAKTQAFDWLRHFVIQNTSIWLASLFPFRSEEKYFAEKHSKIMLRMRSTFWREMFRISLVVELGLNRTTKPGKGVRYIIPVDHNKLFCRSSTQCRHKAIYSLPWELDACMVDIAWST
jgi:hypothetical protein